MRILVTGGDGFIGAHILAALRAAGHDVVGCARRPDPARRRLPDGAWIACDMVRDTDPAAWRPRLAGIDAVINCAGILQARRLAEMAAVHARAPAALFAACEAAGVRRVIQVSALGAGAGADTEFARTKAAADADLMGRDLDWLVVRPSLVYGAGSYGGTSLLRALAALPFLVPVPGRGDQRFQPIHVADLARAVCRLVEPGAPARRLIEAVGPEELSVRDIVLALRAWLGIAPAPLLPVPMGLVHAAARLGDALRAVSGRGTLTTTALRQIARGSAGGDLAGFVAAAGFTPLSLAAGLAQQPSQVQDRWHARLYFVRPLLRLAIAAVWIVTGIVSVLPGARTTWSALQAPFGEPLATALVWSGSALDIALGALLMVAWRTVAVGAAMIALTFGYLAAMSWLDPGLWLDPLGPLLKVLPLMAATLALIAIESDR